jgi:hypothetical protein
LLVSSHPFLPHFIPPKQLLSLHSWSQLSLTRSRGILCWFWFEFFFGRRKRETCSYRGQTLGRGRFTLSLSPCIYTSYKLRWGFWGWVRGVLVRVLVCLKPVLPLPLGSLRQPDCFPNFQLGWVAADSKISRNNCVTADSEIDSGGGAVWTLFFVFTFEMRKRLSLVIIW